MYILETTTLCNHGRFNLIALLLLVACLIALAFSFQGSRGLWQPDECNYVGTAVTMYDRGEVIVPRLGEAIFIEKPPMTYWGIMSGLYLFGRNEWGARFFHALCFLATALTVSLLGNDLFKNRFVGGIAGLIYATMGIPFAAANCVTPDTPLTLWTTVAAYLFWKSVQFHGRSATLWKLLLAIAVGLGFMCKGPAVLVLCTGVFVFLVSMGWLKPYFLTRATLPAMCFFTVVGLSWYFWIACTIPGALQYFVDNEVSGRLISAKYHRNPGVAGVGIYFLTLVLGSLPWGLIWWRKKKLIKEVFRISWWTNLRDKPEILFLSTWFLVPLLIFCSASSKLPLYLLPLFPALALATASVYSTHIDSILSQKGISGLAMPVMALSFWILILLGAKFGIAYYPTVKDSRALWREIGRYIPVSNYEIVAVDEHVGGLLFYGAREVKKVTISENPYPTFSMPKSITTELQDMVGDDDYHIFILKKSVRLGEVYKLLADRGVKFTEVQLSHNRELLICEPLKCDFR